ncbi:MAG: hypothetical protein DRN83_01940 [Hadesarchaea archaeon]|nr:MAG: hypothetical protein DRN83_01940 [Hadesarchaea archaeon]
MGIFGFRYGQNWFNWENLLLLEIVGDEAFEVKAGGLFKSYPAKTGEGIDMREESRMKIRQPIVATLGH